MRTTRRWIVGAALAALGAGGCELVTGLTGDAKLGDPGAGGAAGTTTSGSGGTATGGSGGTGTGGQTAASFTFAIKDASVNVPYGGLNYVNLEILPSGGFSAAVDVTVQGAPAGLVVQPLTIPAGATTGKLQVGADGALVVGTTFNLSLAATSGSLTKTASVPAVVTGKPGDPDLTFAGTGILPGPTNSGWVDLNDIREAGSKILVAGLSAGKLGGGDAVGLRFLADGTADPSFNGTGSVSGSFCGCTKGEGGAIGVARELDGTLAFIGWGNAGSGFTDDIFLFRFTDAGVMHTVQGDNGIERIELGGSERVTAATLAPNSTSALVAGIKDNQLFVAKFADRQAFGAPDDTFAAPNGWIAPALGGSSSTAGALTVDSTGRIVVTGTVTGSDDDVVLLRLSADGVLDPTFGTGGVVTLARAGNQHGSAVLVEPAGTIVVAADTDEGGARQLLVQRFLPSGAPDTTFGAGGAVLAPLGDNMSANGGGPTAWAARMLDGRLVVAGNGTVGATTGAVFARFLPDGSPDPTFGTGGQLAAYVGQQGALRAMSLASDGKLLIAGSNGSIPGESFVGRLWN